MLKTQFEELDTDGDGLVTLQDLMDGWEWSEEQVLDVLKSYDLRADGCLDEFEFKKMMCPDQYRMPEMAGLAREMFGKLLVSHAMETKDAVAEVQSKYCNSSSQGSLEGRRTSATKKAPQAALPVVPEDLLQQWNDVFDG